MLDLHYSDTWADPAHQTKPAAWSDLTYPTLIDSVRTYSVRVVEAFAAQGTPPSIVQIGNEITSGMLWPDGRVGGAFDTPEQWERLGGLLRAAAEGVRSGTTPPPSVMLHIDRGGDLAGAAWFFDRALAQGVEADLLALSFYPWWHGSLADLEATLDGVAERYGLPVLLAETAYPWTLDWFDDENNIVGLPEQLLPGFPATPDGQKSYLDRVASIMETVPGGLGAGVCYWAPDYVSAPARSSPWENLALFDSTGAVLPAARALGQIEPVASDDLPRTPAPLSITPNPARGVMWVEAASCDRVDFVDVMGRSMGQTSCRLGAESVPVRSWAPGLYVAIAVDRGGRTVARKRFTVVR